MHGPWLNRGLGLLALAYVLLQARGGAFAATLDSVNLIAIGLGLLLHPSPASLGKAAEELALVVYATLVSVALVLVF